MRHGVLGPGGVGGLIGAVLADAGEEVTLIVRPGTESLYPREISLKSPVRKVRAAVLVTASSKDPLDILWVTVKATQLSEALQRIPTNFQANAICPLLNGIDHVERLRDRFGHERVIPATIAVESERVAPGTIVHRSPFVRFGIAGTARERLAVILQIFQRFGFECSFFEDEATLMWSKLVFLAPVALSTAAARSTIGDVLRDAVKAACLERCVREACAVATRAGAKVDADVVLTKIKGLPAGMRSSMERDLSDGNVLELDAIAGPSLRGAEKDGIKLEATPELVRVLVQAQRT